MYITAVALVGILGTIMVAILWLRPKQDIRQAYGCYHNIDVGELRLDADYLRGGGIAARYTSRFDNTGLAIVPTQPFTIRFTPENRRYAFAARASNWIIRVSPDNRQIIVLTESGTRVPFDRINCA